VRKICRMLTEKSTHPAGDDYDWRRSGPESRRIDGGRTV
jgi:hypothetical protein